LFVHEVAMLVTKVIRAETKVLDDTRVQAVVSDESEDRDGDIIRQSGWMLEAFQKHPVLLASHDYMRLRSQIGEWEDMAVKGKRLTGVARYYVGEGNEDADWGYNLASKGRAAFSVGFIPLEYEERQSAQGNSLWGSNAFTKQELLEVSHVSIPSNRNALQLMAKAAGLHPDVDAVVKELLAETKEEMGVCTMPGCEQMASVAMPMCKGCIETMMGDKPIPMMTDNEEPVQTAHSIDYKAAIDYPSAFRDAFSAALEEVTT